MSKKIKVLPVGTEVVVVKDTVSHCIPKGTVSVITYWDGSDTAPVYKLEGRDTLVWFSDVKPTETTPKTKETKTMTTKKPGTSHGKPTAKGMKDALKPKAKPAKPKYPAPREVVGILVPDYRNPKSKATKADLVDQVFDLWDTAIEARRELATTGTKLDRALVDLKEAKAKIKELSKALEAAK